jgi:TetR/AcrR family transcriptional regulator
MKTETAATLERQEPQRRRKSERASRELLLKAARREFARKGLEGARVDEIARRAGVNKQLVYHHFNNKDDLYRAVLETVYREIRQQERQLDLTSLDPVEAMRRLIGFSFDYLSKNRDFVALLTDENLHKAKHLRQIEDLPQLHSPLIVLIDETLRRGQKAGLFRAGVDPLQLYISIAGLGFFYFSNISTLSTIFARKFERTEEVALRREHVADLIMHALLVRPN